MGVARLIRPVRAQIYFACVVQAIAAVAAVIPFIAVAEIGRLLVVGGYEPAQIWLIAGIAAVALLVRLGAVTGAAAVTHIADVHLQLHLRREMAAHLGKAPLGWFLDIGSGRVKKALQDDVHEMHHLVGHSYTNRVAAIVTPLVAFGYLMYVSWVFALICLLPIIVGMLAMSTMMGDQAKQMDLYNRALADVNAASVEFAQGIAVIKTFGLVEGAHTRFISRAKSFLDQFYAMVRGALGPMSIIDLLFSPIFSLSWVLAAGLALAGWGVIAAADILPFAVLAPGLAGPFFILASANHQATLADQAARRILDILETPTLPAPEQPQRFPDSPEWSVQFDGVSFSYDGEKKVLDGVDLELPAGGITALVGPSGSGKSTLARLLPRFWDCTEGEIRIAGAPIRNLETADLFSAVSFVFQETRLLQMTIAENIALGRPGASLAEIERAARAAQIHERICELPDGYQTEMGPDAQFSGGEAQRVALARALLADRPVVVLDEATAFADPECEYEIQKALSELVRGKTVLVIAHRLRTIVNADQIVVLDQGRIREIGPHDDLIAADGLYAKMWSALRQEEGALGEAAE
ncbi:MAG: ABC transporter ATP-binding protein [Pseudomonadota bacterium]